MSCVEGMATFWSTSKYSKIDQKAYYRRYGDRGSGQNLGGQKRQQNHQNPHWYLDFCPLREGCVLGPGIHCTPTKFENCMFVLKIAKQLFFKHRTGIWTLGASGDAHWRAQLCGSSCVFLNFVFCSKMLRKITCSRIVLVSGLWAPLGMPTLCDLSCVF